MSTKVLIKGFFAAIFSVTFAWVVFSRYDEEIGSEKNNDTDDRQRYLPYVPGLLLPLCLLVLSALSFFFYGGQTAAHMTLSFCFGIFFHISLYFLVLILVLPFLRRTISARACAMLWMIPNYLYVTQMSYMKVPKPLWVIRLPGNLVWTLFFIWAAGFWVVIGWKIISHLFFRFSILKGSSVITDPEILAVWQDEIEKARIHRPRFRLVVSPQVRTPLSVGLFRRQIRVVLPRRAYSPEELALIFRHEIIHIGREDSWSKFFLMFCTAMCWFNPLMWIARKKSANDLELSCDETVLTGADDTARNRYAELLLKTAGDERGFTTCLSASASALRYRLKNVVSAPKRHSGALTVGIVFFLLCMSCGYTALAYGSYTGSELVYQSQDPAQYHISSIVLKENSDNIFLECTDEEALHRYISSLHMEHIAGNYSFSADGKQLTLIYNTVDGALGVTLSDTSIKILHLSDNLEAEYYYLPEGVDWKLLEDCTAAKQALP